ncbi:MAG: outer rane efflux protein [Deltaproteobacteria bacterium]|nr:outer rane efflux protein [Deltaproteobacteria bacterium]
MYRTTTALAVVGTLGLATVTRAEPITIDQALERSAHRPSIEITELDVDAARANARGAALPRYNPEVSGGAGPQLGSGASSLQVQLGLSQTIELGGKRSARIQVADAQTRGLEIARRGEQLRARVDTWRAFERAVVVRDRLATRREVEKLATALATALQKTAQAGGTTKLRVNVVVAEAGRATQERIAAEVEYASARAALASAIGAGPSEQPEPTGSVADLPALILKADELVARALREHPEVATSDNLLTVAKAQIADADARGATDLTLGLGYAYAPDPDGAHAVVGSISIPLALRNRNQGERAAARIGAKRAAVERAHARVEIERSVRLAIDNYQRARDAVAGFDRAVTERLDENLAAAQDAFAKGGLDFVELTTTQRDLIASRISFLDARLALVNAWADLALATTIEVKP